MFNELKQFALELADLAGQIWRQDYGPATLDNVLAQLKRLL